MPNISDLNPNPKNPRKITKEGLAGLKESLRKFGELSGVVFNRTTGQLVGGHQRVQIFQEQNPEIIMIDSDTGYFEYEGHNFTYREVDWTEAKEYQANLTANNPNISGIFDLQLLPEFLELAKQEEGFELLQLEPLESLLGKKEIEEVEEDDLPEPPADPISQIGDVWELKAGNSSHVVVCGSSLDLNSLDELQIDLVLTDPPYGVDITRASRGSSVNDGRYQEIAADKDTDTAKEFYYECYAKQFPKIILWGGNYFTDFLPASRGWIVWYKHSAEGLSFAQGELAWTNIDANLKIYDFQWMGGARKGDKTLELEDRVHPTQKPVTMQIKIIEDFAPEAKNILDGFLGSGSMLIACQASNRNCYGFEIIPAYVDVVITRWINYCAKNNLSTEVRRNGEIFVFEK